MPVKITKSFLAKLKRSEKDRVYMDSEIPGFGVRCPAGSPACFIVRYKMGGKSRRLSLGPVLTTPLEEAREQAIALRREKRLGNDPSAMLPRINKEITIAYLMHRFLNDYSKIRNKPRTFRNNELYIKRWILPNIGHCLVQATNRTEAIEFRTLLAKSGSETVERAGIAILRKAFNLAEDWGLRKPNSNPFLRMQIPVCRTRMLKLDSAQLTRLGEALSRYESQYPNYIALFRALIFTGCRKNEIAQAKLEQYDRARGVLILPDSKTGERVVTLSDAAMNIFDQINRKGSPWLIPGPIQGKPILNPYIVWWEVRRAASLPKLRLHDLRHLFGTTSHHLGGANLRTVAGLLGHRQLSTAERYTHGMDDAVRTAANKTAEALRGMLG